jgi:hypothetical protein
MGCDVDWIGLAQDRTRWRTLKNSLLNLARKLSRGLTNVGLSIVLSSIELGDLFRQVIKEFILGVCVLLHLQT